MNQPKICRTTGSYPMNEMKGFSWKQEGKKLIVTFEKPVMARLFRVEKN